MRRFLWLFFFIGPLLGKVELGTDRFFRDGEVDALKGKRVALLINHTSRDSALNSTEELFFKHSGSYQIVALFSPEHGFFRVNSCCLWLLLHASWYFFAGPHWWRWSGRVQLGRILQNPKIKGPHGRHTNIHLVSAHAYILGAIATSATMLEWISWFNGYACGLNFIVAW